MFESFELPPIHRETVNVLYKQVDDGDENYMSSSSNEDGWFNRQQNISVFKNPLAYSDQFIEIEDITFDSIRSQDYKTCQADEAEVALDIGDLDLVNKYVHKIKGGG